MVKEGGRGGGKSKKKKERNARRRKRRRGNAEARGCLQEKKMRFIQSERRAR